MTALDTAALPDRGDANARLDALFRAHYTRVTRVARVVGRIVQGQAQAEEIAVDVFLK